MHRGTRCLKALLVGCLFLVASLGAQPSEQTDSSSVELRGTYLGQKPPGLKPEPFAPGIFSASEQRLHGFPAFAPDGSEVYWPVVPPRIKVMREVNGVWTQPEVAAFSKGNMQAVNFTPDGSRILFQATRSDGLGSLDIWSIQRTDSGWSAPANIGPPVNTPELEAQPSMTRDGDLYFAGKLEGVAMERGIFRARYSDGKYAAPELLPETVNSKYLDLYPFVAADGSFLLFSSSRPTVEENDLRLWVSLRDSSGAWLEPINLSHAIGLDRTSRFAYVSPHGKYLFFLCGSEYYWVDAGVIERLRPRADD